MRHYDAIVNAANAIGWPEAYKDDLLVHDLEACRQCGENRPFAWSVRRSGTHLIYVDCEIDRQWGDACAKNDGDSSRYFLWDGETLKAVTCSAWRLWLASAASKLPTYRFQVKMSGPWISSYWLDYEYRARDEETARKLLGAALGNINSTHKPGEIRGGLVCGPFDPETYAKVA